MKRRAEKQLVKDDEEDDSQETPRQGFTKANDSELAKRPIRGLPKRAGSVPSATEHVPQNATSQTISPLPFSSNPLGGTTFKFDGDSNGSAKSLPTLSFTGFGKSPADLPSKSSTPITNNVFSSSTTSPFASGASQPTNTSKAFASLLSNTTTPTQLKPTVPASSPSATITNGSTESVLVKYYTDLRGLNTSLLSSISKGVENDPFIDISSFLEQYKSLRSKIQKEFDDSSTTLKPKPADSSASKLTPPVPPASFAGFGAPAKPTSSNEKKTNILDFTGTSSNAYNPFRAAKDSQPSSSVFGFPAAKNSQSPSSPFGPSAFPAATAPSTTTPSSFAFGTPSKLPLNFGAAIGSSSTSSGFGSASTGAVASGTTADKAIASTNIFGGGDKTSSVFQTAPKGASGESVPGAKVATESSETTEEKPSEEGNSESGTPAAEGADPATANIFASGSNPHDEEGEGEENEETSHSVKVKAYRLTKADEEGGSKWVTLGAGILRLKKEKDTGSKRVLLRNSTNGKVIMNFNIYSGLKPTQTKAAISFIGHDAGVSQTYTVRLANEDDAKQLKGALEKEIESVKAKEGS